MSLAEIAKSYYQQGFNCAESMIRAGNDYYKLQLDEKSLALLAGFGGGMSVGSSCGVLTGGVAVLSSLYTQGRAKQSPELMNHINEFVHRFHRHFDSIDCVQIRPIKRTEQQGCVVSVIEGAKILEDLIGE